MRRDPLALVLLAPLLFAAAGSGPVAVTCDGNDPRLVKAAADVAAAAWKEACALYGVDAKAPDPPPSLHLYREVADYEAACSRLGVPDLKRNLAFTEWKGCTAHVVMQPGIRGEAFAQLAPTWQTLRLVAHETAHLARFRSFPSPGFHPNWFADGNASWVEMKILQESGRLASPEASPYFSADELRTKALLRAGTLPSADDLVHDRTDRLNFGDRYAVRLAWFRFLIEGRRARAFRSFLAELRQFGGGADFIERTAAALKQELGVADWTGVDAEFHAWIEALKPEWDELYRSLETQADVWTQTSFDDANAVAFRIEPAGSKSYALAGAVTLLADRAAAPQANLLLGREILSGGAFRFVSIAIVPGAGVTLFDFDAGRPADAQWRRLAYAAISETAVGKPIAFRVDCTPSGTGTEVSVAIAGKPLVSATVARLLDGPFGVGVQAGSSCIWRGVKQTPAASH